MSVINPFDFFLEPHAEQFPFKYSDAQLRELESYLRKDSLTPLFKAYLDEIPRAPKPTNDFLVELNRQLARDVRYLIRMEPGVQASGMWPSAASSPEVGSRPTQPAPGR